MKEKWIVLRFRCVTKQTKQNVRSTKTQIGMTFPCNVDPLTPHFYTVKVGVTGVYMFSY